MQAGDKGRVSAPHTGKRPKLIAYGRALALQAENFKDDKFFGDYLNDKLRDPALAAQVAYNILTTKGNLEMLAPNTRKELKAKAKGASL